MAEWGIIRCMRIAVLRGGPSEHYEESLKTGNTVLSILREDPKFRPLDIFISRDGEWHHMGKPYEPHQLLKHVDLVWNALHGEYGEDGKLGQLLLQMNIPHTGSTTFSLAMASNKDMSKRVYEQNGLLTPKHEVLLGHVSEDELVRVFRNYLHPVMVKPVRGRGGIGTSIAHSFEELKEAVIHAFKHAERVLVEEFVRGIEARCSVAEGFRGKPLYTFLPTPNDFKSETHKEIERMSEEAHRALGLRHYSSSDFVITPKGRVYILETNALPSLAPDSHLHNSLLQVGTTPKEFVHHVISLAI